MYCGHDKTVRRGFRRGKLRLTCTGCFRSFQVNRSADKCKPRILLSEHLDGTSFRKLGNQHDISHSTAYRKCLAALEELPHCADITRKYCSTYSGILLVDGKFVKVKGWEKKIPVLYGIDFLTHDIPTYLFTVGENFVSLVKFFTSLRLLNYPLRSLVSDDNLNIPNACRKIYPSMVWQLCTNHFKENIRRSLEVRTDEKYKKFMRYIEGMFKEKMALERFNKLGQNVMAHNVL